MGLCKLLPDTDGGEGNQFRLMYDNGLDKLCQRYLFKVLMVYPDKEGKDVLTTDFVIAESAQSAIDQARCARKIATYNEKPFKEEQLATMATRLPMLLEGWGDARF